MIKLLIVDDEKTTREGLLECVPWKVLGVDNVAAAEDGEAALELSGQMQPDIVLTDIRMPKMNGIELAEQIKRQFPQCKFVFLSGYTDKEYLKSAIQLQAINYIEKPVNIEEVKAVILQTISLCKTEQEKKRLEAELQCKVKESLPLLRERLCLELTTSHHSWESIKQKLDDIKMPDPVSVSCLSILIKLNIEPGRKVEVMHKYRDAIVECISRRVEEKALYGLCAFKENEHILLHVFGENAKNPALLRDMLELVKAEVGQLLQLGNKIFIGVGRNVRGVQNIPHSYQTAAIAIQKQFFLGHSYIAFFQDDPGSAYDFSNDDVQTFFAWIMNEKKLEAELFIKRVVQNLKLHPNTLVNNIKNYFFNILIGLARLAEERCIQWVEPGKKEEYFWDVISKADTVYEIEAYILEKIEIFFQSILEKENKKSIVFSIVKYVKSNYASENLSIGDIANHTFLTPNYLSQVFKKETGKTINQFIMETRIEKAKELLKDRGFKLYEIAGSVGFSDANYFAKIFKNSEGINPSEFRKRYIL